LTPVRRVTDVAGSTCRMLRGSIVGIRMTFTASQHNCARRVNALRLGGNGPYSRRARRDTSFSLRQNCRQRPPQATTTAGSPAVGLAYRYPAWAATHAENDKQSMFARQFADARAVAATENQLGTLTNRLCPSGVDVSVPVEPVSRAIVWKCALHRGGPQPRPPATPARND
jgi:hypothetical protein